MLHFWEVIFLCKKTKNINISWKEQFMNTWIFMMEHIYVWKRNFRSGHSQMLFKIDVLENIASFIGRNLWWCRFLIKMLCSGLQVCNVIKKRLLHRCFPSKFATFLTTLYRALPVSASGIYVCFHTAFSLRGQSPFCYPHKMAGETREWFIKKTQNSHQYSNLCDLWHFNHFLLVDKHFSLNQCYTSRTVVKLNQFGGETFLSI